MTENKLICPFCKQELEDANIHSSGLYFECPNCYDKQKEKDDNYTATPKIWQELIKLMEEKQHKNTTRKALDVAVDALREIHLPKQWCPVFAEQEIAKKALEQITALEQKDK